MIKVNFLTGAQFDLKSVGAGVEGEVGTDFYQGIDTEQVRKDALKNALILFSGVLLMMGYEQIRLPELRAELNALQAQFNQLAAKNASAAQAVQQTRQLQKDQELIQKQILAIENLKKGRDRILEILVLIEKNVPQKLWLTQLNFDEQKLSLVGYSNTDSDISIFLDNLSKSVIFQRVDLLRSVEEDLKNRLRLKKFEVECILEMKI